MKIKSVPSTRLSAFTSAEAVSCELGMIATDISSSPEPCRIRLRLAPLVQEMEKYMGKEAAS